MGVSPSDQRISQLIQYAWQRLGADFKVFWLCYSSRGVKHARELANSVYTDEKQNGWEGACILRHTDFGLFLLQLYQTIRRNLPPYGAFFPSVSRLTVPPLPKPVLYDPRDFCVEVLTKLESLKASYKRKLVVATSEVRGLTSACSKVFQQLEEDNVCLWIDMNDVSSANHLFELFIEAAYFRLGQEQWIPCFREIDQDKKRWQDEIKFLARSVNRHWIIFINARETPGANTSERNDLPHGWMDVPEKNCWPDTKPMTLLHATPHAPHAVKHDVTMR